MNKGRELEKQAWDAFGKWVKQWLQDHPEDEDLGLDELALMYPDGKRLKVEPQT